jgi:hypothetical protein
MLSSHRCTPSAASTRRDPDGKPMPYDDKQGNLLEGTDKVGLFECVALVQRYAKLALTKCWKRRGAVNGRESIWKSAGIATFGKGEPCRA